MFISDSVLVPEVVGAGFDPFRARMAVGGFLAGYSAKTVEAYALDLRQWSQWCINHDIDLFEERRAHIELFARWLEETGRARSTIARRLSTIAGFYRYCTEEKLIDHSPAAHVRRPKVSYESNQVGLDRNELGMFLVQAGIAGGRDHALACMLALSGLRISEALGADIEHSGMVRGHRIMTVTRKGGGIVTVPIAPRTGRAIDLCVGERTEGPILLNRDATARLDRHAAARIVRRLAKRAGIDKRVTPHRLRAAFITAALDAGVPSETSKKQYHTPTPGPRCDTTGPGDPSTVTPPTSSPPTSPEPPANTSGSGRRRPSTAPLAYLPVQERIFSSRRKSGGVVMGGSRGLFPAAVRMSGGHRVNSGRFLRTLRPSMPPKFDARRTVMSASPTRL